MSPFACYRSSIALFAALAVAGCGAEAEAGPESGTLAPGSSAAELPNPFSSMQRPWGQFPGGLEWGQVSAVAIDLDGEHVWAADRCGSSNCIGSDREIVLKLDPEGNVVTSFGGDMFIRPHGVHVDQDGHVWITDHQNARPGQLDSIPSARGKGQQVFKFSPEGEILLSLGTAGEPGDPPARLNNPTDVIIAQNGDIFVSEGHSNQNPPGRISKFTADGTFVKSWGRHGAGEGEFRTPHGLAFDSQGQLYVADRGNNRVQVFDQEGNFIRELRQFGRPNDVFIGPDDTMYVIDSESGEEDNPGYPRGIYVGNARTGEVTGFIPPHPGRENEPEGTHGEGVALDDEGNLYVAEVSIRGMTKYVR